ncbi:MAG: hypothetical protein AABX80_00855, partial [Nanoarchaeota archaeon]
MIKTDQEREKEILKYIKKKTEENKWMNLTKKELIRNLKDQVYDDDGTEDIIENLIEKGRIKEIPLKFKILVLKEQNKEVHEKISKHLIPSYAPLAYLLSFIVISILLSFEENYLRFTRLIIDLKTSQTLDGTFIIIAFLLILIGITILNKFFRILINFFVQKIPWIKNNQKYLIPFIALTLIISVIIFIYQQFFSNEPLKLENILFALSMILLGG